MIIDTNGKFSENIISFAQEWIRRVSEEHQDASIIGDIILGYDETAEPIDQQKLNEVFQFLQQLAEAEVK